MATGVKAEVQLSLGAGSAALIMRATTKRGACDREEKQYVT